MQVPCVLMAQYTTFHLGIDRDKSPNKLQRQQRRHHNGHLQGRKGEGEENV